MRKRWFQFADVEVAIARDPDTHASIKSGVHLVTENQLISRKGNGPECDILHNQVVTTILIETLDELVNRGLAAFYRDEP